MRIISLFAGIGGFDLGFERAGHEIVAQVEIDPNCQKLLAARWPNSVLLADVCESGKHNLPNCDMITFGFPCQDLSTAGRRDGLKGKRSGLFFEAMRIVGELQPRYALWENVPGLFSSNNGRDFATVINTMAEYGYSGGWRVLDSQWFGVAQRRRRIFGLFARGDSGARCCAEILSIAESLRGHPAPRRTQADEIAGSVAECPGSRCGSRGDSGPDAILIPVIAGCLQERDAKGADSDTKPGHLIPCYPINTRNAMCTTEKSVAVRRLTPTECERLQGFPDGWTIGFSDSVRYRMLGNAVTVNVAEWIARRMPL